MLRTRSAKHWWALMALAAINVKRTACRARSKILLWAFGKQAENGPSYVLMFTKGHPCFLCGLWRNLFLSCKKPSKENSQTGKSDTEETPWYSSWSLDHLKGVECNPRPLGRHNVEVGKCYLAEPRDKNRVSLVLLSLWLWCSQELTSKLLSRTNTLN